MREWIREKLLSVLTRIEASTAEGRRQDERAQLTYLRGQLNAIEQDEVTLEAMLQSSRDSFHHSLAASTTTHVESTAARLESLRQRIGELEARLERDDTPGSH